MKKRAKAGGALNSLSSPLSSRGYFTATASLAAGFSVSMGGGGGGSGGEGASVRPHFPPGAPFSPLSYSTLAPAGSSSSSGGGGGAYGSYSEGRRSGRSDSDPRVEEDPSPHAAAAAPADEEAGTEVSHAAADDQYFALSHSLSTPAAAAGSDEGDQSNTSETPTLMDLTVQTATWQKENLALFRAGAKSMVNLQQKK